MNSAAHPAAAGQDEALREKAALLASASTHGAAVASVETVETHMSLLFLAGPTVYKLKKPVVYPFLDFSTLAARERNCRDELRLNRRLAPDVYLGLSRITREADGRLALDGAGETVDWLVRMRRLPRNRMLDVRIASGTVSAVDVDALAALLASFYAATPRGSLTAGEYVALLRGEHAANAAAIGGFEREMSAPLLAEVQTFLDQDAALLRARVDAGHIVDGHGDLRPEHVCLNTPPVVIDCLEFNARLRQVDPCDEIVYLGLECARLGAAWIGQRVLRAVAAALGDRIDARLPVFHWRYRACVRARLALAHLADPSPREPWRWQPLAREYLRLGIAGPPAGRG